MVGLTLDLPAWRTHGMRATYQIGCRCVACCEANNAYFRAYAAEQRKLRQARRAAPAFRVAVMVPCGPRKVYRFRDPLTGLEQRFEVVTDLVLGDPTLVKVAE